MTKEKVTKRPTRDEFEMEELGNQITEALHEESEVALTVWGIKEYVRGLIVLLDSRAGTVHVKQSIVTEQDIP
jgi:hypothetical protein